ncbi:uncharacterized protein LOC135941952 isoform X2 [Cloeon dipterum]|uniref:uncharacterized protein LOC135941952 isoform X2 n=1 Tax=Cloeon dipterum TaxID=197152 RepID=UPI0032201B4D
MSTTKDHPDVSLCDRLIDFFDLLHIYFIPSIVLVGVFCNMLNLVVFKSTYLRRRSSSYYLAALSLSDACFLVTLGLIWVGDTFEVDTFNKNGWCQSVVYLSTTSSFLSVWLTVGFTAERFVAVRYPLLKSHICTVAKAKMVVLGLVLVSLLLNSYGIFTAGVVRRSNGLESCDVKPHFRDVLKVITVADSVMTLIIPSVLIGVMNTVILHCLIKFRNQFKLGVVENDESSPSNSIPMANLQGTSRPQNLTSNTADNLRHTSTNLSGPPKAMSLGCTFSCFIPSGRRRRHQISGAYSNFACCSFTLTSALTFCSIHFTALHFGVV